MLGIMLKVEGLEIGDALLGHEYPRVSKVSASGPPLNTLQVHRKIKERDCACTWYSTFGHATPA